MSIPIPILGGLMDMGKQLISNWFPDPEEADRKQLEFLAIIQSGKLKELEAAASVITAEATSESWLTRSWRPITMLTFVALVAAHWLGFTAPNISPDEIAALLDIVKIGLGGYMVSRGAEKSIKEWKKND
jgi:hypothetical protein